MIKCSYSQDKVLVHRKLQLTYYGKMGLKFKAVWRTLTFNPVNIALGMYLEMLVKSLHLRPFMNYLVAQVIDLLYPTFPAYLHDDRLGCIHLSY